MIPVTIGMLWLPFVRRVGAATLRVLIGFTIGLLGFLGVDALLEGLEIAAEGAQAFGGEALVFIGAGVAYLALVGVDSWLRGRRAEAKAKGAGGAYLALLVAIGIGLHNLGEGLAIGSAYAGGALALGAFLVVGFAIHNTTEGLAIVAPLADGGEAKLSRLIGLGLIAGAPAILGAWIGAAAFNSSLVAFLLRCRHRRDRPGDRPALAVDSRQDPRDHPRRGRRDPRRGPDHVSDRPDGQCLSHAPGRTRPRAQGGKLGGDRGLREGDLRAGRAASTGR